SVPQKLAAQEMLPLIQKDRDYLRRERISVYDGPGPDAHEQDPDRIDWGSQSTDDFHLFFRQDPGPTNPLRHIKFMCPNQFDVYLHDTPAGHLFSARERDFSHGCVRLQNALQLAEYLLRDRPGSGHDDLVAAFATSRDSAVKLSSPIAIQILYWTAWVDDSGALQFRDDIYGLDRLLDQALGKARPTALREAGPPRGYDRAPPSPRRYALALVPALDHLAARHPAPFRRAGEPSTASRASRGVTRAAACGSLRAHGRGGAHPV